MGTKSTRTVHVPAVPTTDTFTGKVVSGTWGGGMYVELSFGGYAPVEVINVLNDNTNTVDPRVKTPAGLREIVREWITATSAEWPEFYEGYVENSRR